ncbi:MAG: hypothetical protein MZU95_08075 [Desulfomicrobium escambiense]|nr:hypothetical protein [Desulfomicrobium escambiense]
MKRRDVMKRIGAFFKRIPAAIRRFFAGATFKKAIPSLVAIGAGLIFGIFTMFVIWLLVKLQVFNVINDPQLFRGIAKLLAGGFNKGMNSLGYMLYRCRAADSDRPRGRVRLQDRPLQHRRAGATRVRRPRGDHHRRQAVDPRALALDALPRRRHGRRLAMGLHHRLLQIHLQRPRGRRLDHDELHRDVLRLLGARCVQSQTPLHRLVHRTGFARALHADPGADGLAAPRTGERLRRLYRQHRHSDRDRGGRRDVHRPQQDDARISIEGGGIQPRRLEVLPA